LLKRLHNDRKLALASLLLQRHYIHLATGKTWDSITIQRTFYDKPSFGELHYNVSRAAGIVVLVGFWNPIGVDIVSRELTREAQSQLDLEEICSEDERAALSRCVNDRDFNDLYLVNFAFKEAYMKYIGVPEWNNLPAIEFYQISVPRTIGTYVPDAVAKVSIKGVTNHSAYTEVHNINDTHFVAIFSSTRPLESHGGISQFRSISLDEFDPIARERPGTGSGDDE
jgi:phosphopantetheinyl transferase (holo-ACP synthase)